jgi:hypothetical protein
MKSPTPSPRILYMLIHTSYRQTDVLLGKDLGKKNIFILGHFNCISSKFQESYTSSPIRIRVKHKYYFLMRFITIF